MQVAIIHHQFKLKGGMETYLLNLITGFNNQNDDVTVFVYKKKELANPLCTLRKINLSWLPRVIRKYWFAKMLYKIKEVRNKDFKISLMRAFYQDIIICGGTHLVFLEKTNKKPTLFDRWEVLYERKSYQTSSLIVAHSKLLKDELINLYKVPPEKIIMCYPPVDNMKFNQELRSKREELRSKFGFHPNKKAILFPSTGHRRKGLYILIEAFKKLPFDKFELIIAGSQPAKTLCKNIKYMGFIEDMASLYTAADMTILPSYYEPFGLVVVESIACGTPVIVSEFVGAKDLISEAEGIILDDLSPTAIANAINACNKKHYAIEPNFVERMQLTVEDHIHQLKDIYQKHLKPLPKE